MQRGSSYNSRVAAVESLAQMASAMATDLRHQTARVLGDLRAEADRSRPGPSGSSTQSTSREQGPGDSQDQSAARGRELGGNQGQAAEQGQEDDGASPEVENNGDSDKENSVPEGGK